MLGVQRLGPTIPRCVAGGTAAFSGSGDPGETGVGVAVDAGGPGAEGLRPVSSHPGTRSTFSEREAWTILMGVSGVGPVMLAQFLETFGNGRAVLDAVGGVGGVERVCERMAEDGVPAAIVRRVAEAAQSGWRLLERLRSLSIDVLTIEDNEYPGRLRLVDMPPPLLFFRGSASAFNVAHMVAVVGTRWPTDRGRLVAGWIGAGLANAGACVVSGLAVGIDGVAHAATVAEGGRTVAVLGGGHARLFPKAHERLADEIVRHGGAVVSELPPDTTPSRGTFPRRNRLVSGMADATIIVEAGRRSGALITAGWALEQGRECFVVPGNLDAPMSAGCLGFLRSFPGQARVVCGVPELIEDLGLVAEAAVGDAAPTPGFVGSGVVGSGVAAALAALSPVERVVAERLSRGPATLDDLVAAAGATSAATLSVLTLLELRGMVTASYGRYVPAGPLARAQPEPPSTRSRR